MHDIMDVCSKLQIGNQYVDFIGKGNIWINHTYEDSVMDLTKYVIMEALRKTASGQLSIVGYDSDLSGVFAPFASLSAGESKVLELISDEKEFKSYLNYTWQQIQAVQNVIQGRAKSLLEFREQIQRPVEGYKLIVLSMDMGMIDNETRSKLAMLMRSGPANGVSFLIVSTTIMTIQTQSGKDIELSVDALAPNIKVLEISGKSVTIEGKSGTDSFNPFTAESIIQECEDFIVRSRTARFPVVRFDELVDLSGLWKESSIDGVTFSVGKYGINNMDITIGDEINQRHNAIITGAVGQGKSNLISVIIHSLCQRYSPRELQMYLLDFKEGVTFKPFSNIGQEDYLPHARALGLESDVSFGQAVLDSLFREYKKRMKILKEYNMKSIRELRLAMPDIKMPRIVVIIDEFQMMFGDDMQAGQKIADLLEKSVRLFRAAGIHFILASQTLDNMALAQKKDSIFSQVPIRIALKNSISESRQILGMNNPAAAFLRPREAVVNLDYGEVAQNRKTAVAFADEKLLKPLRRTWWENAKNEYPAPYVFLSEKRASIQNDIEKINTLRKEFKFPIAFIGEKISISGECVEIPMSRETGRNIAIIGTPDSACNNAVGIMQSIAVSLAAQHPKGDARFLFCDFEGDGMPYEKKYVHFTSLMENMGYFVESVPPDQFDTVMKTFQEDTDTSDSVYVFGSGMDRWKYEKDPYVQGSSLKAFVESGPSNGRHFIGWWIKVSNYTQQVAGYGSSDAFNTKVFLRTDERTVQSMTSPFVRWTSQENRALISDAVEFDEEIVFVPYAPVTQEDINKFKSQIWI